MERHHQRRGSAGEWNNSTISAITLDTILSDISCVDLRYSPDLCQGGTSPFEFNNNTSHAAEIAKKKKQIAMRGRIMAMDALKIMPVTSHKERQQHADAEMMPPMPVRKPSDTASQVDTMISSEERFVQSVGIDPAAEASSSSLSTKSDEHDTPVMPRRRLSPEFTNPTRCSPIRHSFQHRSGTIHLDDIVLSEFNDDGREVEEISVITPPNPPNNSGPSNMDYTFGGVYSLTDTVIHSSSALPHGSTLGSPCFARWEPEEGRFPSRKTVTRRNEQAGHGRPARQPNSTMKVIRESSSAGSVISMGEGGIIYIGKDDCPRRNAKWSGGRVDIYVHAVDTTTKGDNNFASSPFSTLHSSSSSSHAAPRLPRRIPSST